MNTCVIQYIEAQQADALLDSGMDLVRYMDARRGESVSEELLALFNRYPGPTSYQPLREFYDVLTAIAPLESALRTSSDVPVVQYATCHFRSFDAEVIKAGNDYGMIVDEFMLLYLRAFAICYTGYYQEVIADESLRQRFFSAGTGGANVPLSDVPLSNDWCDAFGLLIGALLACSARERLSYLAHLAANPCFRRHELSREPEEMEWAILAFYLSHELAHIAGGHFEGEFKRRQRARFNEAFGIEAFRADDTLSNRVVLGEEIDADHGAATVLWCVAPQLGFDRQYALAVVDAWFVFLSIVERAKMTVAKGEVGEQEQYALMKEHANQAGPNADEYWFEADGTFVRFKPALSDGTHPVITDRRLSLSTVSLQNGTELEKMKARASHWFHVTILERIWRDERGACLHMHRARSKDAPNGHDK